MKMTSTLTQWAMVIWFRARHALRWPGMTGIGLCMAALVIFWLARVSQTEADLVHARLPLVPKVLSINASSHAELAPAPQLPSAIEAPAIFAKLQRIVQANGLRWTSASYQYGAASSEALASMEIQTTVKGPYLNIKKSLSTLLDEQPTLGLRELSFTRDNVDMAEVEAKIRLVIFLSDGWQPDGPETTR